MTNITTILSCKNNTNNKLFLFLYIKKTVQDLMRAGVTPCTLLVNECNAGNGFISTDACIGAFIGEIYALKI